MRPIECIKIDAVLCSKTLSCAFQVHSGSDRRDLDLLHLGTRQPRSLAHLHLPDHTVVCLLVVRSREDLQLGVIGGVVLLQQCKGTYRVLEVIAARQAGSYFFTDESHVKETASLSGQAEERDGSATGAGAGDALPAVEGLKEMGSFPSPTIQDLKPCDALRRQVATTVTVCPLPDCQFPLPWHRLRPLQDLRAAADIGDVECHGSVMVQVRAALFAKAHAWKKDSGGKAMRFWCALPCIEINDRWTAHGREALAPFTVKITTYSPGKVLIHDARAHAHAHASHVLAA